MYGWIWGRLPGNTLVRALLALLLFALVVGVLFTWVFPWAEPLLPFNDVTVNGTSGSSVQPSGAPAAPSTAPSTAPSARPSAGAKSSAPTLNGAALPTYVPLAPTGVTA
ncbi:hypothetical protein GXW83_00080 [Streptacidiphilus sp. PB12-B1b]|uniref:hypothetical protein n=1 Tax=Streptacidiphilus sp. PB12-B1b TaxID=2705012 RepID=UPI0015FB3B8D|nr:hypothetical protein [Streptacidiphilus sp. PB12-B1b]QMU74388.1 hypothetical protein GXW83_00080 [Streptacidiphilus sp. PB12-B1b]